MKSSAAAFNATAALDKSWPAVFADLVKARLTLLVLLTTFVGFYLGESGSVNYLLMFHALFGTALVASGAAALNQLLEREYDAKMRRTASRPLPSGRLQPTTVAIFGGVCSVAGLIYLAVAVNLLTSVLGAVTSISYLFIYTPLKRVTWVNTLVGAIPGALPPLMGWTAARNELSGEGWGSAVRHRFRRAPQPGHCRRGRAPRQQPPARVPAAECAGGRAIPGRRRHCVGSRRHLHCPAFLLHALPASPGVAQGLDRRRGVRPDHHLGHHGLQHYTLGGLPDQRAGPGDFCLRTVALWPAGGNCYLHRGPDPGFGCAARFLRLVRRHGRPAVRADRPAAGLRFPRLAGWPHGV